MSYIEDGCWLLLGGRKRREETKNGEWDYHGESGEWFWTGAGEPEFIGDDYFHNKGPSAEMLKKAIEAEEKQDKKY